MERGSASELCKLKERGRITHNMTRAGDKTRQGRVRTARQGAAAGGTAAFASQAVMGLIFSKHACDGYSLAVKHSTPN